MELLLVILYGNDYKRLLNDGNQATVIIVTDRPTTLTIEAFGEKAGRRGESRGRS